MHRADTGHSCCRGVPTFMPLESTQTK